VSAVQGFAGLQLPELSLRAGTVFVDGILLADPALPFGGFKLSGMGRENGAEVLDAYLEPKSVVVAL
jgi:acyl-CoA reductase-like NAD-dependent aldehyde dehydrogenase